MLAKIFADNALFLVYRRVIYHHFQHETVYLSFRKHVCAFLLYGVLRCHYHKWVGQTEGFVANGYLMLLHCLEQCTLNLSRCTVNFVRQDEVCKHRSFLDQELFFFLRIYLCSHYIGWKKVGSKLYATVFCTYKLRKGLYSERLCQPGHAFEQDMPIAEQTNQQRVYKVLLPYNDLVHAGNKVCYEPALLFYPYV